MSGTKYDELMRDPEVRELFLKEVYADHAAEVSELRRRISALTAERDALAEKLKRLSAQVEAGGYACLLRYLLDFHITCDVNEAPNTKGLINQKIAGLEPLQQWWYDTLAAGTIAGGDWAGEWPDTIPSNRLRDALRRWVNNRNIKGRLPNDVGFGRILRQMAPSFEKRKVGARTAENDTSYAYFKVDLEVLRNEFDKYIGGGAPWNE